MKRKLIDVWGVVERLSSKCAVTTGEQFEAFIEALQIVRDAPEVPGQEVEHGEWRETEEPLGWEDVSTAECSVCGDSHILDDWTLDEFKRFYRYCPACGAKMDGGQKYAID